MKILTSLCLSTTEMEGEFLPLNPFVTQLHNRLVNFVTSKYYQVYKYKTRISDNTPEQFML